MDSLHPMIQRAYGLTSKGECQQLYGEWAAAYESDVLGSMGYALHVGVAAKIAELVDPPVLVLDAGCGTGLVAKILSDHGFDRIDGIDLSPEMIAVARAKNIYRNLAIADITAEISLPSNGYQAVACSGTFTEGHVGPEGLDELVRVAAPRAPIIASVRADFWESAGFGPHVAGLHERGLITGVTMTEFQPYRNNSAITSQLVTLTAA